MNRLRGTTMVLPWRRLAPYVPSEIYPLYQYYLVVQKLTDLFPGKRQILWTQGWGRRRHPY